MTSSPAQVFALVFGAVYLLAGALGAVADPLLGTFDVNPLHNVVHLAIGGALVAAARALGSAATMNLAIGAVFLLVALLGFIAADFMEDLLAVNTADNLLHLGSGLLGVFFGTAGARPGDAA